MSVYFQAYMTSVINYKTCVSAGISNHEEYSLVREMTDDEKEKTLTLRRDKSIAKDQKKLEEMRKKLHTDDERTSVSVTQIIMGRGRVLSISVTHLTRSQRKVLLCHSKTTVEGVGSVNVCPCNTGLR